MGKKKQQNPPKNPEQNKTNHYCVGGAEELGEKETLRAHNSALFCSQLP